MNIPKKLEVKRDEQAEEFYKRSGWVPTELAVMNYQAGFSDCANLLLPEIEKLEDALGCISCDCYQTKSDFIPCKRCEALQSWREFLGSEAENE